MIIDIIIMIIDIIIIDIIELYCLGYYISPIQSRYINC
jgi:hypothetical protein